MRLRFAVYFSGLAIFILSGVVYAQTLELPSTRVTVPTTQNGSPSSYEAPRTTSRTVPSSVTRSTGILNYSVIMSNVTDKTVRVTTPFGTFTLSPGERITVPVAARREQISGFNINYALNGSPAKTAFIKPRVAGKDFTLDPTTLLYSIAQAGFIDHSLVFEYLIKLAPAFDLANSQRQMVVFGVLKELARDIRVSVLDRNYLGSLAAKLESRVVRDTIPIGIWASPGPIPDFFDNAGVLTNILAPTVAYETSKILAEERYGLPTDKMLSIGKVGELVSNTDISNNDKKLLSGSYKVALAMIWGDKHVVNCADDSGIVHEATANECNKNGWKIRSDCRGNVITSPATSFSIIPKALAQTSAVVASDVSVKIEPALFDKNNFKNHDERSSEETF